MHSFNSRPNAIKVRYDKRHSNFLKDLFHDYCSNTTLHGIHYLRASDKNWFEKLWWLLVFLLSLIVCVVLINRTWMKWTDNPVIISFNQEQIPIWQIPFPAVTICPINKIDKSRYNYTANLHSAKNMNEKELKIFWDITLICGVNNYFSCMANKTTNEEVVDNIYNVSPKLDDIIGQIYWSRKIQDKNFFASQTTEEGICFTSNSLSQKDMFTDNLNHDIRFINHNSKTDGWTMENGYPPKSNASAYPRRTSRNGFIGALTVILVSRKRDRNEYCGLQTTGFKFVFHNPSELARPDQQYILVPFDKQVTVTVRPEMITTSLGLLTTPPHTRKCFFSHERQLHFYKIYTQNNCKMECLRNMSLYFCRCVPFYLPRGNDTPICGFGSMNCLSDMTDAIFNYEISHDKGTIKSEKLRTAFEIFDRCDCMLSCNSLQYAFDSSQSEWYVPKPDQDNNGMRDETQEDTSESMDDDAVDDYVLTQVDIFFKDIQFLALQRTELYGQTDFIANCGGLLGLFLGFSFLSLMEIIYYLTIRIWCKLKYRKIEQAKITFVHQ